MKKLLETKALVVLFALGGLAALALLTAALRDFSFRPVEPFVFNPGTRQAPLLGLAPGEIATWKILAFSGLLLLIFVILLALLEPEARKRVLFKVFRFALTMFALWYLLNYAYERGNLSQILNLGGAPGATAPRLDANPTVLPEYVPPVISPWLVFGLSLALALGLVGLGWLVYTRRRVTPFVFERSEIAEIARNTLQEFETAAGWDEAIVRCYLQMNQVVSAERGLVRQAGVTPAEFALRMERAGLPGEAVRSLTRLFEAVRYGGKTASSADRDLAAAALNAILHACGVRA